MKLVGWSCDRHVTNTILVAVIVSSVTLVQSLPQSGNDVIHTDRCGGSFQTGTCKSFVHKWFFNATSGRCRVFVYGGCAGNDNRFDSEAQCMHECVGGDEHTLPPYLLSPLDFDQPSPTPPPPSTDTPDLEDAPWPRKSTPPPPPVPAGKRGAELTFEETGHHRVFMFAQTNTFIQLDANRIPNFQLRLCREISFQFRTRLPHGLLVYHSVKQRPEGLDPYALYVIVENGQLKVVHVFGQHSTSLTVGQGLNRDEWHAVTVSIDVHGARLIAAVDGVQEETKILGLRAQDNYGLPTDLPSVVLVGGLSSEEKLHGVKYIIESFVGCIKNMRLSAGKAASDLLPIKPLIATKHENVVEGCVNKCKTKENLCFVGSKCVNHYNALTCDCYGTKYEGEQCDIYTGTVVTLRGSSYISYRVYDWRDRVKSSANRISLFFKTRYDDSALFYASGEPFRRHYIAAAVKNRTVVVEVDFGDGPLVTTIGVDVANNHWHNLTIAHRHHEVYVVLDDEVKLLELPGKRHHLYIDPEIYIGGGPDLANRIGLASHNNFAGAMKYVFFNDISVIYELKKANPKVHYIGVLEPEIYEADVETIPITFPFPSSHIWWENTHEDSLEMAFDFKSSRPMATLASSEVTTDTGRGFWEVRVVNDEIRFELVPDVLKNVTHLTTVKFDSRSGWHKVELSYGNDSLTLSVDYKHKTAQIYRLHFRPGRNITLALGRRGSSGLVGCMRDITVNGVAVEPRFVVRSSHAVGEVSLDNCVLVDPCSRPNTCEHGGKCSVKDEKIICDCAGTGYIGNSCHFAKFRKTCEELALLGYTKPDVYLIDIDGNGPFPPAHVKCEFQSFEESTKTIVEHNLPSQVDVRSPSEHDFSFSIKYREFSGEMLQELISHSLNCSQHVKYDCYKAPLELHSSTWFVSSAAGDIVDHLGNVKRGSCPCALNRTCLNPGQRCNCDVSEGKWLTDEGYYTTPESLGITQMVFLQQKELSADAQGRITLGPLECVETNTQQYVVTFTSSQSYIEVPGWRKGDISFSFRTTGKQAILLYQPPIRPHHPSFMVALTSDFHLTFNFTLNNGGTRELQIKSQRRLNGGEWQKIWIDYNEHHVRFMINTDYEMVDLLPDQEFGPFEGSMFIGGATEDLLANSSVRQGLIGCFRGLVVNGEILDIYSYMSVHLSEIIKDCKPSCDPNPCKNNAQCTELWSTFRCVCENPWAHVGTHCETNINTNALTFVAPDAYIKRNYLGDVTDEEKLFLTHLLTEDILVNLRTYEANALVVYANDHLNNFVQIYVRDGRRVVFVFNVGNQIQTIAVEYPGLNNGKSVQIAIVRKKAETVVHVNENQTSLAVPVLLLTEYANKPWTNPEKEVLAPQRPPAPPTEYFQTNIGGYDKESLIAGPDAGPPLDGFVGCVRGLQIGTHVVNLTAQLQFTVSTGADGVRSGCRMRCDEVPCKNQGVCVEDFAKGESSCNCEHTSYDGEFCATEKGADFGGESVLKRKYLLDSPVNDVKVQLAFSSSDHRQHRTVLLLLKTDSSSSYYLLVALTGEGYLVFEEDRNGGGDQRSMGATIKDRHFLNGARHSVYYQRTNDSAVLLIDREEVPLELIPAMSMTDVKVGEEGANQVQVGGFNSADPRFVGYKSYSGCLSNVVVEVNGQTMKPLEEYMLFTKFGSEWVEVVNAAGVRSAQCADFDLLHKPQPGLLNMSLPKMVLQGGDNTWVEDPPQRVEYKSTYTNASVVETGSTQAIFLILTTFFVAVVILSACLVYRNNQSYKKRKHKEETDAAISWQKSQPAKYQDPNVNASVTATAYKPLAQKDPKTGGGGGDKKNGFKPIVKNDYVQIPLSPPGDEKPVVNGVAGKKEDDDENDGEATQAPVPAEELPRAHHHSIAEEDEEDGVGEEEEEEELLDIPSSKPVSQLKRMAPLSTISEVTLNAYAFD